MIDLAEELIEAQAALIGELNVVYWSQDLVKITALEERIEELNAARKSTGTPEHD